MDLSPDSWAALQTAKATAVKTAAGACDVGDVYLMPGWWVRRWFPDGKNNRPCLVVGFETAADGSRVAHLVGGTKTRGGPPRLVAEVGEANLALRTFFKFSFSGSLAVSELQAIGAHHGRLDSARLPDLDAANAASSLARLRSLPPSCRRTSTSTETDEGTPPSTPPATPTSAAPATASPPSPGDRSPASASGDVLQSGSGSDSLTTDSTSGAPAERGSRER